MQGDNQILLFETSWSPVVAQKGQILFLSIQQCCFIQPSCFDVYPESW